MSGERIRAFGSREQRWASCPLLGNGGRRGLRTGRSVPQTAGRQVPLALALRTPDTADAVDLVTDVTTTMSYVLVAEDESEAPIELPCEQDDTLLMSTLTSHFPDASGLKFKTENGTFRGLRLKGIGADARLLAPEKGWSQSIVNMVVRPKGSKRSGEEPETTSPIKLRKAEPVPKHQQCSDLIVLGLPWKMTESEMKEYFENFGAVVMAQIKKDPKTGLSKGFGFVRFESFDVQKRVTGRRHNISGRWCDVRIPLSRGDGYQKSESSRKIFVGRLTEELTSDDLREYFTQFGEVVDVYISAPFRAFAFVTFADSESAVSLCGEDHVLRSAATGAAVSVHVSEASPKRAVSAGMSVTGYPALMNGTSARRRTPPVTNHYSEHPAVRPFAPSASLPLYSYGRPPGYHLPHNPQVWSNSMTRENVAVSLNSISANGNGPGVQNPFPVNGLNISPALHQLAAALAASPPAIALYGQSGGAQSAPGGTVVNGPEDGLLGSGDNGTQ